MPRQTLLARDPEPGRPRFAAETSVRVGYTTLAHQISKERKNYLHRNQETACPFRPRRLSGLQLKGTGGFTPDEPNPLPPLSLSAGKVPPGFVGPFPYFDLPDLFRVSNSRGCKTPITLAPLRRRRDNSQGITPAGQSVSTSRTGSSKRGAEHLCFYRAFVMRWPVRPSAG